MASRGHEVTVITSRIPSMETAPADSIGVIRIPANNVLERRLGVPYPLFHPRIVTTLLREVGRADVVNGHGHVYMPVALGAVIAKSMRKPFVLTQHNTFIEYRSSVLRTVQRVADGTVGRATIACADDVIAVSAATREYVKSMSRASSTVIYNGVDIARFKPCDDLGPLRQHLSIPSGKTVCLCIRRITFKNGIDTLLEVAEQFGSRSDIVFVIGGDGPDLPLARKIVRERKLDNVRLLGAVAADELPQYYAASDIFVLPSKTGEGLPLVVLEALASGLAVVATRSGGHVEILAGGELGYLVEPGDAAGIAQHIAALVEEPDVLKGMKGRARAFATRALSWEHNVDQVMAVLSAAT